MPQRRLRRGPAYHHSGVLVGNTSREQESLALMRCPGNAGSNIAIRQHDHIADPTAAIGQTPLRTERLPIRADGAATPAGLDWTGPQDAKRRGVRTSCALWQHHAAAHPEYLGKGLTSRSPGTLYPMAPHRWGYGHLMATGSCA